MIRDRELLEVGDKLNMIREPGESPLIAKNKGVIDISVDRLAGPMGFYVVALVKWKSGTEQIFPLHNLIEIQRWRALKAQETTDDARLPVARYRPRNG